MCCRGRVDLRFSLRSTPNLNALSPGGVHTLATRLDPKSDLLSATIDTHSPQICDADTSQLDRDGFVTESSLYLRVHCPPPATVTFDPDTNATYSRGDDMGGRMAACLVVLAVSGLFGCADTPVQVPPDTVSANAAGTDSVALTYICGNMFRIRNSAFDPRNVRWDIYNATPADTGSLSARGRDLGSSYVDLFVTARTNGTMRLFVGSTLIATKANGNKAACAAPVDTTAFPATESIGAYDFFGQPPYVRADSTVDARTLVLVQFTPTASSAEKRAFQQSLSAQIVRVWTASFVRFRIPDPGNSQSSMDALLARIRSNAAVAHAQYTQLRGKVVAQGGARYPTDGLGQTRGD